jgi:hypothetical protein
VMLANATECSAEKGHYASEVESFLCGMTLSVDSEPEESDCL